LDPMGPGGEARFMDVDILERYGIHCLGDIIQIGKNTVRNHLTNQSRVFLV
jgi:hypothetical protein